MREKIEFIILALRLHLAGLWRMYLGLLLAFLILFSVVYSYLAVAPTHFPNDTIVTVPAGASIAGIAELLYDDGIVAHPGLLTFLVRVSGQSRSVHAGAYRFRTPVGVLEVAYRLVVGAYGITPVRVTLLEGTSAREMGIVLANLLPSVSASGYLSEGKPYEGYLFPDTYVFAPNATASEIVARQRATFDTRVASVTPEIDASGHSLSDVVILASILEREARSLADKRMVAGILWNRIRIGMPLQVDAVFGYIHDRETYAPSLEDLKVDSPYNTYVNKGLPPGPINNPGLDAIEAAATPTKTDDLYYLTGSDGQMHYAKTFAEHKANRALYLK